MKRITIGLCALVALFLFNSCDLLGLSSPADRLESLAKSISEKGDEWDADDWESAMKKSNDILIDFAESKPGQKEYDEFNEALESYLEAINDLDGKAQRKMEKASDKVEKSKEYKQKIKSAEKKLRLLSQKYGQDEDDMIGVLLYLSDHEEDFE